MLPETYELDIYCIADELRIDQEYVDFNIELNLYQVSNIEIKNIPGDLLQSISIVFNNCKILNCDFACLGDCACLFFANCSFECEVNIHYNLIDFVKFLHCIFYKQFAICSVVKQKVDFGNSYFKDYADFHECNFDNTACFYGVTFDKTPNFSQAIFKGNLNVVNTNLNFAFDNLEEKIKQEYNSYKSQRIAKEVGVIPNLYQEKSLDKFANDFRDSFRTFKNALIKDNNLLDASNFHKYELYCKEIELKFKKPKTFSREWMDKWQLFFYRKLCDHHTDLLLNLRWLVVVVGFFVSVLFVLRYGDGNLLQFFNKDNDLLKILKDMLNIKALNDSDATYLILLYSFIGLFFVRTFFIFYYLVIFILMLAMSPYNLFSVVNFVTKDQSSSFLENIITVAYALIMILVLFSLQKTARKSSIVPS
ncbi:TPA: pentapeptide repeat-containing protein [Campylobacter coli]|nr:pentapeptide repeat-containing protein [Campylobacter coli]